MEGPTVDPQVHEALVALEQYLSDQLAPLIVADSIGILITQPPEVAAGEIRAWIASQYRTSGAAIPISDYLFHAIKKIFLLGQLKLIPEQPLEQYLGQLSRILLEYCPEEDREILSTNLGLLGHSDTSLTPPVAFVHRQMGTEQPLASQTKGSPVGTDVVLKEVARSSRQLGLLLEHMERQPPRAPGTTPTEPDSRTVLSSQIFSVAADSSKTESEFREFLDRLGHRGLPAQTDQIFRALSRSVPGWVSPSPAEGEAPAEPYQSEAVSAMKKIINLAEDTREAGKRLREMVQAAVEQLNQGSLTRAATMLELAEEIAVQKPIDPDTMENVRRSGHKDLNFNQLRKLAENPDEHALLRKVFNFFNELSPGGLLDALRLEEKRDRRRMLLELLEVHGTDARDLVYSHLEAFLRGGSTTSSWYCRNLIYLLRRIPHAEDSQLDAETDSISRLAQPGYPVPIVREALSYLGQRKHPKAEQALITCARNLEELLLRPGLRPEDLRTYQSLLDRTVSALARYGTTNALRAVVELGLKRDPRLGDTLSRLAYLAGQDLSPDKELVERLLKALQAELPTKVLGFIVQRATASVNHLIGALSTTPSEEVMSVFQEIVQKYSNQEFARLASKALDGFAGGWTAESLPTKLSGELDTFGLPNLLQKLAQARQTGVLTLKNDQRQTTAVLAMREGKILGCQMGRLKGESALYELFEKPASANYIFSNEQGEETRAPGGTTGPLDVVPLIREGMRRYDGYMKASALVPDDARLTARNAQPTAPAEEKDTALVQLLWKQVQSGATAAQCEAASTTDAYRVRGLLAHWVEQSAVQLN